MRTMRRSQYDTYPGHQTCLDIDRTREIAEIYVIMDAPVEQLLLMESEHVVDQHSGHKLKVNLAKPRVYANLSLDYIGGPSDNRATVYILYEPKKATVTKWVVRREEVEEYCVEVLGVFETRQEAINHVRRALAAEMERDEEAYQRWLDVQGVQGVQGDQKASIESSPDTHEKYVADGKHELDKRMIAWSPTASGKFEWSIHYYVLTEIQHYI